MGEGRGVRWLHRLYAFVMGYFWLPCPLCGEHFGGHEARGEDALWREYGRGQGVCPRCGEDGTLVQAQKAIAERPHFRLSEISSWGVYVPSENMVCRCRSADFISFLTLFYPVCR